MTLAIESKQVSFSFMHENEVFLKDINLQVKAGECILICGPSGSGKTSFTRLLNGVSPNFIEGDLRGECYTYNLQAGQAEIEDYVPIVGSVFQNPKTQHFAVDTTSELAFPLENMGMDPEFILAEIESLSHELDIEYLMDRSIFDLSGGQKQQIAFATANIVRPKVLVLDEPTSNLDDDAVERIKRMIQIMKKNGVTIVLSEHRLAWTKDLVDRYFMFDQGQLVRSWTAAEFNKLDNVELHQLGLRAMDLTDHNKLLNNKRQTEISNHNKQLTTHDLAIGYKKGKTILSKLNLSFAAENIIGIMGDNGTGKSTLSKTLTGLMKPLQGQLRWNNKKISPKELVKKSFLVMQDTNYQLFSDSVEDEVLINAKYPEKMNKILGQLNLLDLADRHPMSLSGGQKQRVAIASALLSGKEILIFDEPTSGLDYQNMQAFGQLLEELKDTGVIIIVITHDIELASQWCDTIIRLEKE